MDRRVIEMGERLRRLREKAGFSQDKLSELLGCSVITISRWENGHTVMNAKDIVKVSEILNVSTDYLLGVAPGESEVIDMLIGLNTCNREIVKNTLNAMTDSMKLYQE